jgi:hypothetical protein
MDPPTGRRAMQFLSAHPHALGFALFLLALGLLPLVLAWRETRSRAQGRARLQALRREARVTADLRGVGFSGGTAPR